MGPRPGQACLVLRSQELHTLAYYTPEILTRVRFDSERMLSKKKKKQPQIKVTCCTDRIGWSWGGLDCHDWAVPVAALVSWADSPHPSVNLGDDKSSVIGSENFGSSGGYLV